jgi:hypothetical protein
MRYCDSVQCVFVMQQACCHQVPPQSLQLSLHFITNRYRQPLGTLGTNVPHHVAQPCTTALAQGVKVINTRYCTTSISVQGGAKASTARCHVRLSMLLHRGGTPDLYPLYLYMISSMHDVRNLHQTSILWGCFVAVSLGDAGDQETHDAARMVSSPARYNTKCCTPCVSETTVSMLGPSADVFCAWTGPCCVLSVGAIFRLLLRMR